MLKENKKGLSPVVATMLLIALALLLAVIIFFWAKNFIGEKVQKFDNAIELACDKVVFDAEIIADAAGAEIRIANKGTVALYGIEIQRIDTGSIENIGFIQMPVAEGATEVKKDVTETADGTEVIFEAEENLKIAPVLLGTQGDLKKHYSCDGSKYGQEVIVKD